MSSTVAPVRSIPVPLETERGTYGMMCTILTEGLLVYRFVCQLLHAGQQ